MIIVAAKGSSFTAKLIKFLTKFLQTHFALRYEGDRDQIVVHSEAKGVQLTSWGDFNSRFSDQIHWKVMINVADQAADNLVKQIGGKPYDNFALYGLGFILLLRKIGINISKNILGNKDRYMCTEAIISLLEECKKLDISLSDLRALDSEMVTVEELVAYLDSYPQYFKRI